MNSNASKENANQAVSSIDKPFFFIAQYRSGYSQGCAENPNGLMEHVLSNAKIVWLDYLVNDVKSETPKIAEKFGFNKKLVSILLKRRREGYEDFDSELGLKLPAIYVKGLEVVVDPVIILIRKNIILTIHGQRAQRFMRFRRYAEVYMRKISRTEPLRDKITRLLSRIIDENNSRNFDHLREIEEYGDTMSKRLMDLHTPRAELGPEIYNMKHALIVYLDALWETIDVLNSLRYGDANLLTDDPRVLARIELLAADVNRQIALSEHMSEVLASGLEVLQSIYNNQLQMLNNRMAFAMTYLTILGTAVLVPNTIATVLANPLFNMTPQDEGWYLALIVGSTIVSTAFAYFWVKRQGWMPKTVD